MAELRVAVPGGELVGWVREGEDPGDDRRRVLMLHGGPGLGYGYLDGLADDIGSAWTVASFQQRGLEPSSLAGPFDVATAVADVEAVIRALGWPRPLLLGHSWGGHLALHAAVRIGDQIAGVLAIDPLGAVGDGGVAEFSAELLARTPAERRARYEEIDKVTQESATVEQLDESFGIVWPAYFADPASAPPYPHPPASPAASYEMWDSIPEELPALEAALRGISVPVGVVMGGRSPLPASVGTGIVERVPGAWLEVLHDAGHFTWMEVPGRIEPLLRRLVD